MTYTEGTRFLQKLLEDGQWHEVSTLHEGLKALGYSRAQAAGCIGALAKASYVEREYAPRGPKRQIIARLRGVPQRKHATTATCSSCGTSGLFVDQRVRRRLSFESSLPGRKQKTHARLRTFLCIPCAKAEVEAHGGTWRE